MHYTNTYRHTRTHRMWSLRTPLGEVHYRQVHAKCTQTSCTRKDVQGETTNSTHATEWRDMYKTSGENSVRVICEHTGVTMHSARERAATKCQRRPEKEKNGCE